MTKKHTERNEIECACCEVNIHPGEDDVQWCPECRLNWCGECWYTLPNLTKHDELRYTTALMAYTAHDDAILIDELYVKASERGKGIARALFRNTIENNPGHIHIPSSS